MSTHTVVLIIFLAWPVLGFLLALVVGRAIANGGNEGSDHGPREDVER